MSDITTTLNLDSSNFTTSLETASFKMEGFGNKFGRHTAKMAGEVTGLSTEANKAMAVFAHAIDSADGSWSKFAANLGTAAVFTGAALGISAVIDYASKLNKEIQDLQKAAGEPVKGFWANWADGMKEILGMGEPLKTLQITEQDRIDAMRKRVKDYTEEFFEKEQTPEQEFASWLNGKLNAGNRPSKERMRQVSEMIKDSRAAKPIEDQRDKALTDLEEFILTDEQRLANLAQRTAEMQQRLTGEEMPNQTDKATLERDIAKNQLAQQKLQKKLDEEKQRLQEQAQDAADKEADRLKQRQKKFFDDQESRNLTEMTPEERIDFANFWADYYDKEAELYGGTETESGLDALEQRQKFRDIANREQQKLGDDAEKHAQQHGKNLNKLEQQLQNVRDKNAPKLTPQQLNRTLQEQIRKAQQDVEDATDRGDDLGALQAQIRAEELTGQWNAIPSRYRRRTNDFDPHSGFKDLYSRNVKNMTGGKINGLPMFDEAGLPQFKDKLTVDDLMRNNGNLRPPVDEKKDNLDEFFEDWDDWDAEDISDPIVAAVEGVRKAIEQLPTSQITTAGDQSTQTTTTNNYSTPALDLSKFETTLTAISTSNNGILTQLQTGIRVINPYAILS